MAVIEAVKECFEGRSTEETGKLGREIANLQVNLMQWMFVCWLGQIGVLIGFLLIFLRKERRHRWRLYGCSSTRKYSRKH